MKADHPALPWMVMRAADPMNRYCKGTDGLTPYRRVKGNDFGGQVVEFGEEVLYMKPGIAGKDKLEGRWETGIWLGSTERSGETIVGTQE